MFIAMKGNSIRCALKREPLGGEKRRAAGGEYTLELTPKRPLFGPSRRVPAAPVTAQECVELREAVYREGTANQRWYRE